MIDAMFVQVRLRDLYDALIWHDGDATARLEALAIAGQIALTGHAFRMETVSGSLMVNGVEYPCVNGEFHLIETPFTRMIAEAEHELLDRYRRGGFDS